MALGTEWVWALVALAVAVVALTVAAFALQRTLAEIRRQNVAATQLLHDVHERLARIGGDQYELTRILLETGLRDLRRLAGSTQAALEGSVRELRRAGETSRAVLASGAADPLRPTRLPPAPAPGALVVVRRGETNLYELLRDTADQVVWDRRQTERRARRDPAASERRRRERRRPPPRTWEALGFVVTAAEPGRR